MIRRVSAIEQNRAIKKTCCLRMPCLKTKAFCAPIATINERPRKKPVKKADSMIIYSYFLIKIIFFAYFGLCQSNFDFGYLDYFGQTPRYNESCNSVENGKICEDACKLDFDDCMSSCSDQGNLLKIYKYFCSPTTR